MKVTQKSITAELTKLFKTFYNNNSDMVIEVKCLKLVYEYIPERGDEVATYAYNFHITIHDKVYLYNGWCYENELPYIAVGIYSHWLLSTKQIYNGPSTAWYTMYTGIGNIIDKEAAE